MPQTRTALSFIVPLAVGLPLSSCRQVVGIPDVTPTSACGLGFGSTACASCASANCCGKASDCAGDRGCLAYESCLGACQGDPACRASCTAANYQVATAASVSELSACLVSHCESACGLTCGGVAGYVTEAPSASACQTCIEGEGTCDHARAWAESVDGDAYWRCVMSCTTPDCRYACQLAHPHGKSQFDAFQRDYSGPCADACRYGNYWACIGKVTWPKPNADVLLEGGAVASVNFTFSVFDVSGTMPWPGEDVSICQTCPCPGTGDPAIWTGTSNDAGVVRGTEQFRLDVSGVGLHGCMEITSPPTSSPALAPTICYWDYPLSESQAGGSGNEGCTVLSVDQLGIFAATGGYMLDPRRSYAVVATVYDCLGAKAPNVTLSMAPPWDSLAIPFYGTANDTFKRTFTSGDGIAGILNVPIPANFAGAMNSAQGTVRLIATPIGEKHPSSQVDVTIQAGTVTEAMMYPTPALP